MCVERAMIRMMCARNPIHVSTLFLLVIVFSLTNNLQCEGSVSETVAVNATTTDDLNWSVEEPIALPLISDNLYTNVSKSPLALSAGACLPIAFSYCFSCVHFNYYFSFVNSNSLSAYAKCIRAVRVKYS